MRALKYILVIAAIIAVRIAVGADGFILSGQQTYTFMQGNFATLDPQHHVVDFTWITRDDTPTGRIFADGLDDPYVPWSVTLRFGGSVDVQTRQCWAVGGNGGQGLNLNCSP